MCALAVNALSLPKRKTNLLKRFVICNPITHCAVVCISKSIIL
jgi:hypothetical protein